MEAETSPAEMKNGLRHGRVAFVQRLAGGSELDRGLGVVVLDRHGVDDDAPGRCIRRRAEGQLDRFIALVREVVDDRERDVIARHPWRDDERGL